MPALSLWTSMLELWGYAGAYWSSMIETSWHKWWSIVDINAKTKLNPGMSLVDVNTFVYIPARASGTSGLEQFHERGLNHVETNNGGSWKPMPTKVTKNQIPPKILQPRSTIKYFNNAGFYTSILSLLADTKSVIRLFGNRASVVMIYRKWTR